MASMNCSSATLSACCECKIALVTTNSSLIGHVLIHTFVHSYDVKTYLFPGVMLVVMVHFIATTKKNVPMALVSIVAVAKLGITWRLDIRFLQNNRQSISL